MKKLLLICSFIFLLSGCTKSNIVTGQGPAVPEFETKEGIVLNWDQIGNNLDEIFTETEDYPMGVSVNYSIDPENKVLDLTLLVEDNSTPEEAVEYATAVMKGMNDEVATQDFNYTMSSSESYGGFFKEFTTNLIVMPNGSQSNEGRWLVDMTIEAGSDAPVVPVEREADTSKN